MEQPNENSNVSNTEQKKFAENTILLGFPSSGKSSFLAALYNYVISNLANKSLQQYKPSNDTEYLNLIHNRWLTCTKQQRTQDEVQSNQNILLFLKDVNQEEVTLSIPDIAGEVFKRQWELRIWEKKYKEVLLTSTGVLFFINTQDLVPHVIISDVVHGLGDFLAETKIEEYKPASEKWMHDKTPTQVRIVEILQFHLDELKSKLPVPIVFILSLWDKELERAVQVEPEAWLKINLPLLHQYIKSNPELITYEVIGVSAQGGDYANKAVLLEFNEPAERVKVAFRAEEVHNDITLPITWIMKKWRK